MKIVFELSVIIWYLMKLIQTFVTILEMIEENFGRSLFNTRWNQISCLFGRNWNRVFKSHLICLFVCFVALHTKFNI